MPLRVATPEDIRPLAELWAAAFPMGPSATARAEQIRRGLPYGGLDTVHLEEASGRVRGAFRAYRLTQYVAGVPLSCMGLAGVAVSLADRRRGLAADLCKTALRLARERGDTVSTLFPFRPSFYRRLGWGAAGRLHAHVFSLASLPDDPEGRACVRPAREEDRDAIVASYERVAASSNGLLRRTDRLWEHHLGQEALRCFVHERERISGYVLARFGKERLPDERVLYLRELVAEDEATTRALLAWAGSLRDQWTRARYEARPDEHFGRRLDDPRPPSHAPARELWHPVARVLEGPMLRVLDVSAALAAPRRWGGEVGASGAVELVVRDPELPGNEGPWRLEVEEGAARVSAGRGGPRAAHLETDAATFGSIYAGELAPRVAARLGLAAVEGDGRLLDSVFSVERRFWLLDNF